MTTASVTQVQKSTGQAPGTKLGSGSSSLVILQHDFYTVSSKHALSEKKKYEEKENLQFSEIRIAFLGLG